MRITDQATSAIPNTTNPSSRIMSTVFIKVLTPQKAYTSKLAHELFRVMVAVKGEEKSLPLIGPKEKMGEFPDALCHFQSAIRVIVEFPLRQRLW